MLPDNLLQHLKSENELLHIQLQDVNDMIRVREEELELLREKAALAVLLQSKLDMNLDEFYQMQDHIFKHEQQAEGSAKRESSLETELLQSIDMETEFYNLKDELASTNAAFADINSEMDKMASLYRDIATLTSRVASLESNLEIATLENGFIKEELEQYRREEKASEGKE